MIKKFLFYNLNNFKTNRIKYLKERILIILLEKKYENVLMIILKHLYKSIFGLISFGYLLDSSLG